MKRFVCIFIALVLLFKANARAEGNPIETYEDLVFYCNYACMTYPYIYGGDDSRNLGGYDCTGFVMHVYEVYIFLGRK